MVIFEVRSIYVYFYDRWCAEYGIQTALQGSKYTDECVPTFQYPGRQEILGMYNHTDTDLYDAMRNSLVNNSVSHFVIWQRLLPSVITGCGFTITFKDVLMKLTEEFPNKVHVVPDGTNTCTYLQHIGISIATVPVCSVESQITGTGSFIDEFGGRMIINSYVGSDTVNITIITPWGEKITQNVNSGITLKFSAPYKVYNMKIVSILNATTKFVRFMPCYVETPPPSCIPEWICDEPRTGWESDGCGYRRYNLKCDPDYVPPLTPLYKNIFITGGITIGLLYLIFKN